jgi:hypothetical protein
MFAVEKLNVKTHTGLDICIVCDKFGASSSVQSDDIVLEFKWKVCAQSILPFRNVENPTLKDYYYEPIAGVAEGLKTYSNSDLRVDLEIIDGVPNPKFEQAKDEFGNLMFVPELDENGEIVLVDEVPQYTADPVMIPVMIGNIDFWLKFGGSAILQDLAFTLSQIKQQPVTSFIKEFV